MAFKNYREESRCNYGQNLDDNVNMPQEGLKVGALLRIADAAELMAKNYQQMQRDLDYYKVQCAHFEGKSAALERRINSLRGVITRMKKATTAAHKGERDE